MKGKNEVSSNLLDRVKKINNKNNNFSFLIIYSIFSLKPAKLISLNYFFSILNILDENSTEKENNKNIAKTIEENINRGVPTSLPLNYMEIFKHV